MGRGRGGGAGALPPAGRRRAPAAKGARGLKAARRGCAPAPVWDGGGFGERARERPVGVSVSVFVSVCVCLSVCLLALLWAAAGPVRSAKARPSLRGGTGPVFHFPLGTARLALGFRAHSVPGLLAQTFVH